VDNFAVAAPDEHMTNIFFDMIDDELTIPMKCQGYLDTYNVIDIEQKKLASKY
jgi:hypothetical protein